jgi:hypothetical protein
MTWMQQWRQCLPCLKSIFSIAVKFFSGSWNLNTVKELPVLGKLMLESQSKTVNLLPIGAKSHYFLQPFGEPPSELNNLYMP